MNFIIAILGGLSIGGMFVLLLMLREVYAIVPFYAPRWTVYAGLALRILVALLGFALIIFVFRLLPTDGNDLLNLAFVVAGTVLLPVVTRRWSKQVASRLRPRLLPSRKHGAA